MPGRVGLALLAVVTACYSPPEPDCGFMCGPDNACPADYTCADDNQCHLNSASPSLVCGSTTLPFDIESVASTGNEQLTIIFNAAPDPVAAANAANYTIEGLATAAPVVEGMTVVIATSAQVAMQYDLIVSGITRASDSAPLTIDTATFTGRTAFDVISAQAITAESVAVTFDAPPDPIAAIDPQNYVINETVATGASLAGNVVTVQFSEQGAGDAFILVNQVARASDLEPLTVNTAMFTSIAPFYIEAESLSNTSMSVTFSDPPDPIAATTLANYAVNGVTLSALTLIGTTVTFTTSPQQEFVYTVTVSNVTRVSDGEPLDQNTATFFDAALEPTATDVAVVSTAPNNGTTPYNTGTIIVQITGTNLGSVECPGGVVLEDLDGNGLPVNTQADSCNADSETQLTANFGAWIRTNGATGWSVIVTNGIGSTIATVPFVPLAGLLISEVYPGTSGADDHEFVELYNPTTTTIILNSISHPLHLHVLDANGVDTDEPLTMINTVIPSHGFYLLTSATSDAGDAWFAHRDATYPAALVDNGGVYVNFSLTAETNVVDKVGWGTQPAPGFEGTALVDIPASESAQRKPAGGAGDATDTDNNAADFNAPSTAITPLGTVDPPQP